jgi:hypothetical protein
MAYPSRITMTGLGHQTGRLCFGPPGPADLQERSRLQIADVVARGFGTLAAPSVEPPEGIPRVLLRGVCCLANFVTCVSACANLDPTFAAIKPMHRKASTKLQ